MYSWNEIRDHLVYDPATNAVIILGLQVRDGKECQERKNRNYENGVIIKQPERLTYLHSLILQNGKLSHSTCISPVPYRLLSPSAPPSPFVSSNTMSPSLDSFGT